MQETTTNSKQKRKERVSGTGENQAATTETDNNDSGSSDSSNEKNDQKSTLFPSPSVSPASSQAFCPFILDLRQQFSDFYSQYYRNRQLFWQPSLTRYEVTLFMRYVRRDSPHIFVFVIDTLIHSFRRKYLITMNELQYNVLHLFKDRFVCDISEIEETVGMGRSDLMTIITVLIA